MVNMYQIFGRDLSCNTSVEKVRPVSHINHDLVSLDHHLPPDILLCRVVSTRSRTGQGMIHLLDQIFVDQSFPLLGHADPYIFLLMISTKLQKSKHTEPTPCSP